MSESAGRVNTWREVLGAQLKLMANMRLQEQVESLNAKLKAVRALADELYLAVDTQEMDGRAERAVTEVANRLRTLIQTPTEAVKK